MIRGDNFSGCRVIAAVPGPQGFICSTNLENTMSSSFRNLVARKPFGNPALGSLLLFAALSLPILAAIWFVPWFVTQDGPLHIYNAHIAAELGKGNPYLQEFYVLRQGFLPYVGAYKLLAGLLTISSAWTADRLIMTVTSIGFAGSVLWLRWRVAGWQGMAVLVPLILVISINRLWLYGLYPFLLGACLFPITLGLWWQWRDHLNPLRVVILALLFVLNYFFHIISAGFTVLGVGLLAVTTPGTELKKRWAWTAASIAPVALLMIQFQSLMKNSGEAGFQWVHPANDWSLGGWLQYFQFADFISISFKSSFGIFLISTDCPFVEETATRYALLMPSLWALLGIILLTVITLSGRVTKEKLLNHPYRGWILLILCLMAVALFGPSRIGTGSLLRERLWLLATAALIPLLRFNLKNSRAQFALLFLALALLLQTAFVWHYALLSNRTSSAFMEAGNHIEPGKRITVVVADIGTHYLINPFPIIANQLGVSRDNVVWNNLGPSYYYFPVAFQNQQHQDTAKKITRMSELFYTAKAEETATRNPQQWEKEFGEALDKTDVLVIWGAAPWFDAMNAKLYHPELIFEKGGLRVFKHK
jgi:hypothetical protein